MNAMFNKNDYPLISLVVTNFNGVQYLKRTLSNFLNFNYPNFEVILIDNGSTDGSREFVRQFTNVMLVVNPLTGSRSAGLNLGIQYSKGEYIFFVDNDILINDKELLTKLFKKYSALSRPGILGPALINEGEEKVYFYGGYISRMSLIRRNARLPVSSVNELDGKPVVGPQGAAFFMKKSIFDEVGLFDELTPFGSEDIDLGIRTILLGYNNYIFSNSLILHIGMFERTDNIRYKIKFKKASPSLFTTILKNFNFPNAVFCFILFSAYQFLKVFKDSLIRKDSGLMLIYLGTFTFLFKHRSEIIAKRRDIQRKRIFKNDIFFKVRLPNV